jgi:TolB protein
MLFWGMCSLALAGCGTDEALAPPDNQRVPAARQLTYNDDILEANPIYSPDGAWILFESEAAGNRDIWRLPAAGGTAEQLTRHEAFDSSPYWAPDGRRIVFESDRSGRKNIWILDLSSAGAGLFAVTNGDWDDGSPAWSPDGRWIVYESNRSKSRGTDLWVSPADGGAARRVTETPTSVYHRTADWSPDGTRLVFESDREQGQPALFITDVFGAVVQRLTPLPGYEGHPAWSPEGSRIAYEATTSGTMEIWIVAVSGGGAVRLTNEGGFWPRWSPDGASIVYGRGGNPEPNLWSVAVQR